ncbi:hypothetical protein D3C87_481090 [compost metagenome]
MKTGRFFCMLDLMTNLVSCEARPDLSGALFLRLEKLRQKKAGTEGGNWRPNNLIPTSWNLLRTAPILNLSMGD